MNKRWRKAAGIRAVKTAAQTMLAFVGVTGVTFGDIDWVVAISTAGVAALASILTSIAGLPEIKEVE